MTHEADLDGRCENCGMLIGFHGTHASDAECVRDLKEAHVIAVTAIREAYAVVRPGGLLGLGALAKVEEILAIALAKLGLGFGARTK
jgi:hypothetical protein